MSLEASQPYSTHNVEPVFHPQMRKTKEVIRRPEWVKHTGEAVAHRGSIGSLALFGILFANCVGGGYGFEDGIGSAGPLITLIVCIVLPWIWVLPTGLAIAELSTAVPSNSGILMWANASLPSFLSFLCILATVFITFIGNATYPNLTSEYVANLTEINKGETAGIKIAVIVICCVLNCVGVEIVGNSSIVLCVITILPFSLMTVIQLFGHGFNAAVLKVGIDERGVKGVDWASFFSIISWNYANIENAGSVVEEIANPRKSLPYAMVLLVFGTYVGYVMPMLAGVSNQGIGQDYTQWQAGHWPLVAKAIAGDWLRYMLFAGAMLSGVGFTLTNMCCTSRLLAGMGTMEMFPKKLSRVIGYYHPRLGTPIPAILISSAATIVFSSSLDFGNVVSLCQALYCMRMLVIYVALVKLRIQYPRLRRPYALPCNTWLAALCLAPAAGFSLMCAIVSAMTSLAIGIALVCFMVGGCLVSWLYCRVFAKNGFQGVIVQCVMSDEEEANQSARGDGDGDEALDEGVFYHEGEDDVPADLLLGILPMTAAVRDGESRATAQEDEEGSGSIALGSLPGGGAGHSSFPGDKVGEAEYLAREEAIGNGGGGGADDGGGTARAPTQAAAGRGRRGGKGREAESNGLEMPLRTSRNGRPTAAAVGYPTPRDDDDDDGRGTSSTSDEEEADAEAEVVVRKAPSGMRKRRGGASRGASRDPNDNI